MEYLMTYGWAIIIVVVVFIALLRLGVFTPSAGTVATGFNEFTLGTDFKIDSTGIATLLITNADKQSRAVTMTSTTVDGAACTGDDGIKGPGEQWTVSCINATAGGSVGAPYAGISVSVYYNVGGLDHTETGTISGEYE